MRRHTLGLAISAILAPSLSYALGLGEISTNSALNQPLDAEIELVSTSPGEVDNVTVSLAPNAVFDQVGIERTSVLDGLRFKPTVVNGVPVIKVSSASGIQEPFINFVIEVAWPKGKLLREYTVLLDPPVLSEQGGPPPASMSAPVAAQGQAPFAIPPAAAVAPVVATADTYPVQDAMPVPLPVSPQTYPVSEAVDTVPMSETFPVSGSVDSVPMSETFSVSEAMGVSPVSDSYAVDGGLPPFSDSGESVQMAMDDVQPLTEFFPDSQAVFEEPLPYEGGDAFVSGGATTFDAAEGTSNIFVADSGAFQPSMGDEQAFLDEEPRPLEEPIFVSGGEAFSEEIAGGYAGGDSYKVNRGDTLSSIARQLRPDGINMNRMMAAFAQANPGAFADNSIHKLKSGYVLRIPDAETIASIDNAKASDIIANKGGAWQQYKTAMANKATPQAATDAAKDAKLPQPIREGSEAKGLDNLAATEPREIEVAKAPGLEIVSPEGDGDSTQGAADAKADTAQTDLLKEQIESTAKESEELRSRVAELEALLAAKDRLIDLKDQQLAEMQTSLDDSTSMVSKMEAEVDDMSKAAKEAAAKAAETAKAAVPEVKGLLPDAETTTAEVAPVEEPAPVVEEPKAEELAPVVEEPKAVEPTAVTPEVTEEPAPAEEASGQNPRNLLLGGGAGLLLLALLAWWSSRRKSGEEDALYDTDESDQVKTTITETSEKVVEAVEPEPEVATEFDNELSTGQFDAINLDDPAEETSHSIQIDASELDLAIDEPTPEEIGEDLTSVGIDLNEDEVLSEANVYLAYGLHDQAIDLLKPVVDANPDRIDYQAKLAEAFHATGDKNNFAGLAERMHSNLSSGDDAMWQRTAVMGKDLLPDHDLFKDVDTGDLTLSNIRKDRPDLADLDLDDMPDLEDAEATLSMNKADLSQEFSGDLSEEFQLPELDELDQSLQTGMSDVSLSEADKSQQINLDALELDEALPNQSQLMDENLTLAEMENELSDLTTGVDHIGTKLDLAKAYIDMGDEEGAREALSEVISQGSDGQQGEAKKLLEQLT